MRREPVRVGVIGCGQISGRYLENARRFAAFEVVAVADARPEAARARAAAFGVPKALAVDELLADLEVELVLTLTLHRAHGPLGAGARSRQAPLHREAPRHPARGGAADWAIDD